MTKDVKILILEPMTCKQKACEEGVAAGARKETFSQKKHDKGERMPLTQVVLRQPLTLFVWSVSATLTKNQRHVLTTNTF